MKRWLRRWLGLASVSDDLVRLEVKVKHIENDRHVANAINQSALLHEVRRIAELVESQI